MFDHNPGIHRRLLVVAVRSRSDLKQCSLRKMLSIILTDAVNLPVLQLNLQALEWVRTHSILKSYRLA